MPPVRRWIGAALIGVAAVQPSAGQEADPNALTRQQWNEHVREQQQRFEQMRREGRSFAPAPPTPEQLADQRVRQAFDDPALMPGDVVVTQRGHYRYLGTPDDRERQPQDFVPIETPGRR